MNMDKVPKTEAARTVSYSALLADAECCARCGRAIFFRAIISGQWFVIHGDNSICAAGPLEP